VPSYTADETARIVEALKVLGTKGFPVPSEIFDAWCGACIVTSIELSVLRNTTKHPEVLMIYRKDKFFHGWHVPGTIILPGDTEESAMARLLQREVGVTVTPPQFVDRGHVPMGNGPYENPRGQEVGNAFVCYLIGAYAGKGSFFPLFSPPEDTLGHHKLILKKIACWWS